MTQPHDPEGLGAILHGEPAGFRCVGPGRWIFAALVLVALAYAAIGSWFACGGHLAMLQARDLLRAGLIVAFGLSSD